MKKLIVLFALVATLLTACNGYGKKKTFGKGELYYTEKVTEQEAQKAGEFLQKSGYLNNDRATSLQIDKVDSIYKIRIVVDEKYHTVDSLDFSFTALKILASMEVFDNKPVEIDLCDDRLETKRTIK